MGQNYEKRCNLGKPPYSFPERLKSTFWNFFFPNRAVQKWSSETLRYYLRNHATTGSHFYPTVQRVQELDIINFGILLEKEKRPHMDYMDFR